MALCECSWFLITAAVVLLYKIFDKLVRIPKLGSYADRYIFVTGCDTGFGNQFAKRLDGLGCHVFAGCLTEAGEVDLGKTCSRRLKPVRLDVANPDSIRKAYQFVKDSLPHGKGLWGLMNNAGILGRAGRPEWLQLSDYRQVADVNIYGLIDMTITFLPLIKQEKGRVVNTASVVGRYAYPGSLPYTVSKYGVEAFTDGLRRSLRQYGVKALLIEPGFHKTNITSTAAVNPMLEKLWNSLTPEARAEYGDDYLREIVEMYAKADKTFSDKIWEVVDAYEHALLGLFPRARYVIGNDAKFFWLPLQWMPEWLGDWILELLSDPPLPVVLKKK